MFNTLHLMFEIQYNELWTAVDLIAERIRSLGFPAPGTYSELGRLTSIEEVSRRSRGDGHGQLSGQGSRSLHAHRAHRVPGRRQGR